MLGVAGQAGDAAADLLALGHRVGRAVPGHRGAVHADVHRHRGRGRDLAVLIDDHVTEGVRAGEPALRCGVGDVLLVALGDPFGRGVDLPRICRVAAGVDQLHRADPVGRVVVVGHRRGELDRLARPRRRRVGHGRRGVVDPGDLHGDLRRRGLAVDVFDLVREAVVAAVVLVRRVGHGVVGVDGGGAVARSGAGRDRLDPVTQAGVVGQDRERDGYVLEGRDRVGGRRRLVVDRVDGDVHPGRGGVATLVHQCVGPGVVAVVVGGRLVGDGATDHGRHAVLRDAGAAQAEGATVRIPVVGQGVDGDREVLVGRHDIVHPDGRLAAVHGGHGGNAVVEVDAVRPAEVLGVAEGQHLTVGSRHVVAIPAGRGGHVERPLLGVTGRRPVEPGVAEGEDPPIAADQPVAPARRRGGHRLDSLHQVDGPRRAEEGGVTEGEDPPVGRHQPVAPTGLRGGHAHDRLVQRLAAHRTEEGGVAEGKDPAVRGDHPVAVPGRGGGQSDDGLVEGDGARRAVETGLPEVEEAAVDADQPIAGRGRRARPIGGAEHDSRAGGGRQSQEREGQAEATPSPGGLQPAHA